MQKELTNFEQAGIGVVAITYDAPELQQPFLDAAAIAYPVLSDIDAETVRVLGILNEQHKPGEFNYGIPHPGVFVLSPQLQIVGKIFVEGYATRVDSAGTLAYAKKALNIQLSQ